MGDIRYVCLSDMHFGADNSLLSRLSSDGKSVDPAHASDVLVQLVAGLRHLINANTGAIRPTLILNGDIFDLAFSSVAVATECFQNFLLLAMPEDPASRLFADEIWHIPGNHDHHLWESARDEQRINQLRSSDWKTPIAEPSHTTAIWPAEALTGGFVELLVQRLPWLAAAGVRTVYPTLGIANEARLVLVTHGHFTEAVYLAMSMVAEVLYPDTRPPATMEDLESENGAWIDFIWSALGRSGRIGPDEEAIYNLGQSPHALGRLIGAAAKMLLLARGGKAGAFLADGVAGLLASIVEAAFERGNPETVLGDTVAGLQRLLAGPLRGQVEAAFDGRPIPSDIAIVFGHTHKPFEQSFVTEGFLSPQIKLFNSGGWVVDSATPQPLYGGAVILIDEQLDIVSLRMFNEAESRERYFVRLAAVDVDKAQGNLLFDRLRPLVIADAWPWSSFSAAAFAAVQSHNQLIVRQLAGAGSLTPNPSG